MGIWSTLFSSGDTINKATDAVISAGDKIWYTEEEKAEMKMEYGKFLPTLLKAYEPFKIAQRILAISFTLLFSLAFLTGLSVVIFNIVAKYKALRNGVELDKIVLLDLQPLLDLCLAFELPIIMGLILTWYFGGGFIESFKKSREK